MSLSISRKYSILLLVHILTIKIGMRFFKKYDFIPYACSSLGCIFVKYINSIDNMGLPLINKERATSKNVHTNSL